MALVEFDQALQILEAEGVVALPTETVYGLAARIDSEAALKKIFSTKQRPFFDPLIVHLSSSMNPKDYTLEWPLLYQELTEKFWPGPLTLIAPKNINISDLITSGLPDVALRCPDHSLTQDLLQILNIPVAAPSANLFGKTSPTQAQHVLDEFQNQVPVVDGGACLVGVESTVVQFDESQKVLFILRPGQIHSAQLREFCHKFSVTVENGSSKAAPGQLKNHYQPSIPVVLEWTSQTSLSHQRAQAFSDELKLSPLQWTTLCLPQEAALAARCLYGELRKLSQNKHGAIWIPLDPVFKLKPEWEMVINRLERAASLVF